MGGGDKGRGFISKPSVATLRAIDLVAGADSSTDHCAVSITFHAKAALRSLYYIFCAASRLREGSAKEQCQAKTLRVSSSSGSSTSSLASTFDKPQKSYEATSPRLSDPTLPQSGGAKPAAAREQLPRTLEDTAHLG